MYKAYRFLTIPSLALLFAACSDSGGEDPEPDPPSVVATVPADGATGVDVDAPLTVTFSQAMDTDRGTITLDPGGVIDASDATWSDGDTALTASPLVSFPESTTVLVDLSGFASADGESLPAFSFTFTTQGSDTTAPQVADSMPADGATDVAVNLSSVTVVFDEPMDQTTGTARIDGGATLGSPSWSSDTTVSFDVSDLTEDTTYTVDLSDFSDLAGNVAADPSISFTTGIAADMDPPAVSESTPAEGATDVDPSLTTIELTFDEAMDPNEGEADLVEGDNAVRLTPTWGPGGTSVSFEVSLAADTTYSVALAGFTDLAGNALDGTPYLGNGILDFTTGVDTDRPEVAAAVPTEATSNVPVGLATITIDFDEPMSTTTTVAEFAETTLSRSVDLTGVWSDGGQTLTFDITDRLELGRTYRLDLRDFTDVAGNALDPVPLLVDGWLDFSTAPDRLAPTVVSTSPAEGDATVPPNVATIVVTFSEAVDRNSLATGLSDGVSTTPIAAALSADGRVATYAVAGLLMDSTTYAVDLSGVTDIAGNPLNGAPYLDDGVLDFTVPAPPTGFDCTSPLTTAYATFQAGGTYTFQIPGGPTGENGSLACDATGGGDDIVIAYDKQSDTLANGGQLLHVSAVSASNTGFNVEVLSGSCTFGASSTQHHCYWNKDDLDVFLDVPAGRYWIWVGRNTNGDFQGGTIDVEEVPPAAAEGEGCWLPWSAMSSNYTAPVTPNDPHVWTITATAVNSFDMDVTWGGVGSISCDDTPPYGDIHGVDTVIEFVPNNPNAVLQIQATAGAGSTDEINMEVLDICESRNPARSSLACTANTRTAELLVPPGTSPTYIWLSTEATSDEWPGATVEVREIMPGFGESCATAKPLSVGINSLNPTSGARLGAPTCLAASGSIEWYTYGVNGGRVQINANSNTEIGVINASGQVELGCNPEPATLGFGRIFPVGTQLCIAVPTASATELIVSDTVDNYAGVGTSTAAVLVTPATSGWNVDYWMAASPSWVYFGRSAGTVQRFANTATTSTTTMQAVEVFSASGDVGYAGLALPDERVFSLDNTASASNSRLAQIWDGIATTFSATPWDLTPSYPSQDARSLTTDGTDLIYATHETGGVEIYGVPLANAQSPTQLGSNTTIDNVFGIAADNQYIYFAAQSVVGNVDGLYRIERTQLTTPSTPAELVLAIDVGSTANPIYLDDPTAPQYLYVREGNPAAIHVVEAPQSNAPVYRGVLSTIGGSADYAWTYDPSSNSIYLYETVTTSDGQILRLY